MADEADKSFDTYEAHVQGSLATHRAMVARKKEVESEGACGICDNYFSRLVLREVDCDPVFVCARCRDKYRLG